MSACQIFGGHSFAFEFGECFSSKLQPICKIFCLSLQRKTGNRQMTNRIKIILMTLATMSIIVFSVLPHHHHEDGHICFVMMPCAHDGQINDEHTGHENHENKERSCKMNLDKLTKSLASVFSVVQSLPLLSSLPNLYFQPFCLNHLPEILRTDDLADNYLLQALSGPHERHGGLRAPPFVV